MRHYLAAATLAATLVSVSAHAQSVPEGDGSGNTFRGIRVEANAGGDWFKSQGISDNRFGYGGTIGFDGLLTNRIVFGPEASYWNPSRRSQNCTAPTASSIRCDREGRELGVAVRAGYLVAPDLLLFGKGGFVNAQQSGTYSSAGTFYYLNGVLVGPNFSSYHRMNTDGYQLGGGVEYSVLRNIYVDAQYVYSRYDDHTRRQRVMGGIGLRFW